MAGTRHLKRAILLWAACAVAGSAAFAGTGAVAGRLDTAHSTLVFALSERGAWRLPFFGPRIEEATDALKLEGGSVRWHGETEHLAYGVYGTPLLSMDIDKFGGLAVRHADGSLVSDLVAVGSAPREVPDEAGVRHLVLDSRDRAHPLFVSQHFRADEATDVIETWVEIRHQEPADVELLRMDSFALSLPRLAHDYAVHSLSSWWGNECELVQASLAKSQAVVLNSRNGVRGAWDANPAFMLSLGNDLGEDTGRVLGGVLAWSGAWRVSFRRDWGDVVEVCAGVDNGNGAYRLEADRALKTPSFAFTYSERGRGQVSRSFHRWARTRWLPHRTAPRDVVLNSWEGSYLAFTERTLTDMMDGFADLGGELFVLDDGWFGTGDRARDHHAGTPEREGVCDSALGDWVVNRRKLPHGLEGLSAEAARRGLKFGVWVEPEMVSVGKCAFFDRHPDAALAVAGRALLTGRGGTQAVADFTNPAIVADLFGQLERLWTTPGVAYVKWDANANIFNPGSSCLKPERQGNVWFDYTQGVYGLLERLRKSRPDVVVQACASGGGRLDYGTLRHCDEAWVSDNTDARQRVFIQWGASQFYPASALAAHVTASPNHQTGRSTPLKFRFDVAMSGRLGFELHPKSMTPGERAFARRCIADYKRLRDVIQDGDLFRLVSPYGSDHASLMFVSRDGRRAVVFVWGLNRGPNRRFPARLRLKGLSLARRYRIDEINRLPGAAAHARVVGQTVSGQALMAVGLDPLLAEGDYDSAVFELTAEDWPGGSEDGKEAK